MEIWQNTFRDKLYRFALRLLNSSDDAADIAQDVWLKLWQRKEEIPKLKNAEAFAFTMTRNLCLDVLKSTRLKNERLDSKHENSLSAVNTDLLERNEQSQLIHQAINNLTEQQRTVIHLRDVEGYELSEIAETLNISENNTKVILCRARQNVREAILNFERHEQEAYSGSTR